MATPSDNHGFDLNYGSGEDWNYNEEMEALESKVEVRDTATNRSNYTPHSNAKFVATDTGEVHLGDGSSWNYFGTISDPAQFAPTGHDNAEHSLAFISDGDGVQRQIWVSSDGTTPSGAATDDIVLTPSN